MSTPRRKPTPPSLRAALAARPDLKPTPAELALMLARVRLEMERRGVGR